MKKFITLLLVLTGMVSTASATRIYVKLADGVPFDRLYTWDSADYHYTSDWGDGNSLTSLGSDWYYIDTWKAFDSDVKWIIYNSSNDSERIERSESFVDVKGKYLNVTSSTTASWESLSYVAYSPTNQTELATLSSEDGVNYSGVIDNVASYDDDLDVLLAPEFLLSFGYGPTSVLWSQSFRPWDSWNQDNTTYDFKNVSGSTGIFGGSNNWALTYPLYYTVTLNIGTDHDGNNASFTVAPYVTATLNANGYGTFGTTAGDYVIPAKDTDGNDVKAYYAASASDKLVSMTNLAAGTEVNEVEGLFLIGTASKTVKFTPASGSPDAATNLLKRGLGETVKTVEGSYYRYVFSGDAFKLLSTTGVTVPVGKAYLEYASSSPLANELTFSFDDGETTSIRVINTDDITVKSDETFNVAGQRVVNPTKGLYIVNGKKVMVK